MRTKATIGVVLLIIVSVFAIKYFAPAHKVSPQEKPQINMISESQHSAGSDSAERFYQKILRYKSATPSKLQRVEQQVNAKQAFDRKDWDNARTSFMRVIADNPEDFQAWLFLCKTLQEMKNDTTGFESDDHNYTAEYQSALIKAEQFAKSELDKAVIKQMDSALIDQKVQAHLHALLDVYPKEFVPYFLDIPQQTDIGTACISWTHPLVQNRDFHYENAISLNPNVKDLGVIARGNKLCLEGLQFGENYQLTFKPGFPGEHDAKLEQEQSINLFIPHRKPTIRFRERGYILSSFGQQVVPFVAVNVPKVQVKIIHIPDRNIHSVQGSWFSNQIGAWEFNSLSEEQGELIWEGTYHCASEINKTGISGLPIDKMLGKNLQPGVYVIEARISETSYESNDFTSQALIVSDIGLSTYKGPDGLHIMARNLSSAKSMEGVQITLVAKNNRELATAKSDSVGIAHFSASQINGVGGNTPAFLTASLNGKQFTVLNLRNEAFDLNDRGAKGRQINGPLAAYVFSERGIYRPGETVHLLSLLRKANGEAERHLPLTMMVYRPDGVLAQTTVLKEGGEGAYQLDYPVNNTAPTGIWSAAIYLDPNSKELGRASFEVQDFVPPRIEVKAMAESKSVLPHQNNPIQVTAQYYFGPPGADLKVKGESLLTKSLQPFPQWQGYQFGLEEESWTPLRFELKDTTTDSKGQATLDAKSDVVPQTSHLLQLETTATVFEVGGRGQQAKQVTEYWNQPFAIGIKPRFKDRITTDNSKAVFDLIALNQKGELQTKESLSFTLFSEQHDYIWFRSGNQWQYEIVVRDKVVTSGKLNLTAKAPSQLEVPVDSGLYRLEILDDKTGVASSLRFSAGWFYSSDAPDKPDVLDLKVENDKIFIKSPFAGEVFLAIAGQTFKPVYSGKIGTEGMTLDLPALKEQVETGAYLIGTVYRPAEVKTSQMPARAIGVHWFENEKSLSTHKIDFTLEAPTQAKSNKTVEVKIKVPANHKKMRVSAALVDEATLSLTRFKSPDPFDYFFSQRELAFELRDSYGLIINPFGARPGSFEEGGDGVDSSFSSALTKLPAKSYKVVSLFSGIIEASDKEIITLPFEVPEFSGKLRLMAIAWDEKALGSSERSIIIRDEVDIYFVLPRFLAAKDKATIPLVLRNLEGKEGEYKFKLITENQQIEKTLFLKKDEEKRIPIDLKFDTLGVKSLQLKLEGPNNLTLSRSWEISIRPKVQSMAVQQFGVVLPQKTLTLDASIFKNLENTSRAYLTLGAIPDFGSQQLTKELISYPYLCLEQTTSRMLATALSPNADKSTLDKAFNQLSSLQKIDGSFGLWSSASEQEPWLSLYASDVMDIVKKQGLAVPSAIKENLASFINEMQQSRNISLVAYASYLNAKNGRSTLGALRYFVETHQQEIVSKQECAFIAAAFAYYNEPNLATFWFNKAIEASATANQETENRGFGSDLRETAILVALLAETTKNHPKLFELANTLSAKANEARYLSTQEKAWLIRAAHFLSEIQKNYQFSIDNQKIQGNQIVQKTYTVTDLKNPIKITNLGSTSVFYSLSTLGEPIDIKQLNQQGFEIAREIYSIEGKPADLKHLKSGDLYLVLIKGQRLNDALRHVLLVDLLPAGFEIEDPNLLRDNLAAAFPWLGTLTPTSRIEGRDDRFVSAYEFNEQDEFSAAYSVRAVTKGTFTYPAVYIEAMYQPQNFKYGTEQTLKIE